MNIAKLKRSFLARIRLRPVAIAIDPSGDEVPVDDVWLVAEVADDGVVELHNNRTGHIAKLGADHVHHFDSDPVSDADGLAHGFFTLTVQVVVRGAQLRLEPLPLHARLGLAHRHASKRPRTSAIDRKR